MMRKLVACLLVAIIATLSWAQNISAQTTTPLHRCNVGADPVNPNRQPDQNERLISNPADQRITYASKHEGNVSCVLQAGVPVVVDAFTGVAKWVYGCGNDILTPWTPKQPAVTLDLGVHESQYSTSQPPPAQPVQPVDRSQLNVVTNVFLIGQQTEPRQHDQDWAPVFGPPVHHGHTGLWWGIGGAAAVAVTCFFVCHSGSKSSSNGNANTGGNF